MKSLLALSLLTLFLLTESQSCAPLTSDTRYQTYRPVSTFVSAFNNALNNEPFIGYACNSVSSISNPSTTIKILGKIPTSNKYQTTPFVNTPAYYQTTGTLPWGSFTPINFETNYVKPLTSTTTKASQPVFTSTVPVTSPTLSFTSTIKNNPQLQSQTIHNQGLVQRSIVPELTQFNYQTISHNIGHSIPQPIIQINQPQTLTTHEVPILTVNSIVPIQQFMGTQIFSTGSNLIPIIGPTPVPVSYGHINQVISTNLISSSFAPLTVPQVSLTQSNMPNPILNPLRINEEIAPPIIVGSYQIPQAVKTIQSTQPKPVSSLQFPITLPIFSSSSQIKNINENPTFSTNTQSSSLQLPKVLPLFVSLPPNIQTPSNLIYQHQNISSIINASSSDGFNLENLELQSLLRDYGSPSKDFRSTLNDDFILSLADLKNIGM